MNYYKATRPDGTDFMTGRIDYGAALVSGEVVRHREAKKVRNDASTYLSVSIEPADCTGFTWPCRLFRVKPVGRIMKNLSASPNKRAVSALRVVEERPAHEALGPNGEQMAAFIEGCAKLTVADWLKVTEAWNAARDAATWATAWDAAVRAARDAEWTAARAAARDAVADAVADVVAEAEAEADAEAAWEAARDAARAVIARGLITPEQYDILTQPFVDAGFAGMVGR